MATSSRSPSPTNQTSTLPTLASPRKAQAPPQKTVVVPNSASHAQAVLKLAAETANFASQPYKNNNMRFKAHMLPTLSASVVQAGVNLSEGRKLVAPEMLSTSSGSSSSLASHMLPPPKVHPVREYPDRSDSPVRGRSKESQHGGSPLQSPSNSKETKRSGSKESEPEKVKLPPTSRKWNSHSSFVRDPEIWHTLSNVVLWHLAKKALERKSKHITAWSCGCSTGEEVYSLRMSWLQRLQPHFPELNLKVLGSDLSKNCISTCKRGCYAWHSIAELPKEWQDTFFESQSGVRPQLGQMSDFGPVDPTVKELDVYGKGGSGQAWKAPPPNAPVSLSALAAASNSRRIKFSSEARDLVEFELADATTYMPDEQFDLVLSRYAVVLYTKQNLLLDACAALAKRVKPGGFLVIGKTENLPHGFAEKHDLVRVSEPNVLGTNSSAVVGVFWKRDSKSLLEKEAAEKKVRDLSENLGKIMASPGAGVSEVSSEGKVSKLTKKRMAEAVALAAKQAHDASIAKCTELWAPEERPVTEGGDRRGEKATLRAFLKSKGKDVDWVVVEKEAKKALTQTRILPRSMEILNRQKERMKQNFPEEISSIAELGIVEISPTSAESTRPNLPSLRVQADLSAWSPSASPQVRVRPPERGATARAVERGAPMRVVSAGEGRGGAVVETAPAPKKSPLLQSSFVCSGELSRVMAESPEDRTRPRYMELYEQMKADLPGATDSLP